MVYTLKAIVLVTSIVSVMCEYNVDVIDVGCNSSHPDIVEIDAKIVRMSRGVFGISGFINIKQDIDINNTMVKLENFYSANGITYLRSPYAIPLQTIEHAMNSHYKYYLMDGMAECCTNVPVGDVFVTPLTKRYIDCENCQYPSKNFPSGLRKGFYKITAVVQDVPKVVMWVLLKIDPE